MSTPQLKLIALILILLIVGMSSLVLNQEQYAGNTRVYAEIPDSPTPTPTVIVPEPVETELMDSPDGTKTLTMERQKTGNRVKYSFFTSSDSKERYIIYTKTLGTLQRFSIPFNTWSPDNTYFFVKESTPARNNYYVFLASGEKFSNDAPYLDIQPLFEDKVNGYVITDVTGWAAPTLLIVNTQKQDGEEKMSFWFDITSQSFIRLGTYFE